MPPEATAKQSRHKTKLLPSTAGTKVLIRAANLEVALHISLPTCRPSALRPPPSSSSSLCHSLGRAGDSGRAGGPPSPGHLQTDCLHADAPISSARGQLRGHVAAERNAVSHC